MGPFTEITIAYSVNAGICVTFPNQKKIWFDFFPDGKTPLFSHMTDEEWNGIKKDPKVTPPDLILFSHTHPDHFSAARVKECAVLWPEVPVYLPAGSRLPAPFCEADLNFRPISGEELSVDLDGIHVRMLRTVHSGKEFVDVPHYSFLLTYAGKNIFVAGDAHVSGEKLGEILEYTRTDLAILTFPWASTNTGRERVEYTIHPGHVLLYHIPNEEDDHNKFRKLAAGGKELLNCPDVRSMTEPGQTEVFRL